MQKVTDLDQKSSIAEAYRTVRANISFSDVDNEMKTILFTSTRQNEGKSTLVTNIAYSFSKLEHCKVLVVDLDLRNPSVHKMFQVSNTYGVMEHLKNDRPLEKCVHKIDENMHVLTTGAIPPNPAELLSSKKMVNFLQNIKNEYDYVFIDSPPVGIVADATIIGNQVDGVMYVVGADETDLSHAQVAIENLKKADANIIGSVLNKYAKDQSNYSYYGYYYYQQENRVSRNKKKKGLFRRKDGVR